MHDQARHEAALKLLRAAKSLDAIREMLDPSRPEYLGFIDLKSALFTGRLDGRRYDMATSLHNMAVALRELARLIDPTALLDGDLAPPTDPVWTELLRDIRGLLESLHGTSTFVEHPEIVAAILKLRSTRRRAKGRPPTTAEEDVAAIVPRSRERGGDG
jgi:hypothetical protein